MAWQKVSGYNWRALVEADISRFKRVIGERATIPNRSASSDRGYVCRERTEPDAGTRTSGIRPPTRNGAARWPNRDRPTDPCWGGRPRGISCQGLTVNIRT